MRNAEWSEAMEARLRRLWPHARALDIAAELGLTKNAVIGKARRLGLERKKQEAKPKKAPKPRTVRLRPPALWRGRRAAPREDVIPTGPGVPFAAAGPGQCRWIVSADGCGFSQLAVCGRPAWRGSWCAHHRRRALQG